MMKTDYHIGILDILQTIFIVLKSLNVIQWSWWVVLIPFWIILLLSIIFYIATKIIMKKNKKQ